MMEIRPASVTDVQSLFDIEKTVFDYDLITLERMRYLVKSKTAMVLKGVLHNDPVGYMILLTRKNSRVLRIYSLGVLSQQRRSGFGRKFLCYAEERGLEKGLERIHLEVHANNTSALNFYQSEGYTLYGHRVNYYTDGGRALLLRKAILSGGMS